MIRSAKLSEAKQRADRVDFDWLKSRGSVYEPIEAA